jgi:hypothetical protein
VCCRLCAVSGCDAKQGWLACYVGWSLIIIVVAAWTQGVVHCLYASSRMLCDCGIIQVVYSGLYLVRIVVPASCMCFGGGAVMDGACVTT